VIQSFRNGSGRFKKVDTFPPFINPADPVDPVIRVLFPFHGLIVAPIYRGGLGLICIPLSRVGLPGVNLIIYKDDLRMMA
jgi:hypothetical protein